MTRGHLAQRVAVRPLEPDLPEIQKAVILHALQWAWSAVCARWPEVVASGTEEQISAKICLMLNDMEAIREHAPGLTEFETVQRGGKVEGYDRGIEYQPDLTFRPFFKPGVRDSGAWGWFVECKLITGRSSVSRYCKFGVQRFVDGRYAARMPSAAMLAYVRDGQTPYASLQTFISGAYGNAKIDAPDPSAPERVKTHHERLHHEPRRSFQLTHLWLDAS